jgi:hypothetical protein
MSFGLLRRVIWWTFTDVSEVLATSIIRVIALMIYQTTRRNIPEDSLHICRRDNLKSHSTSASYKT